MAIAFDNSSTRTNLAPPSNPQTSAHTINSNTNGVILVYMRIVRSPIVSATVTYNGTSMTELATYSPKDNASNVRHQLFYLVANGGTNYGTGSQNFSVTFAATPSEYANVAVSYTGVDQTTPVEAGGSATSSGGTTKTLSITSTSANAWIVGGIGNDSAGGLSPANGETERVDYAGLLQIQDILKATAGAFTLTWNTDTSSHTRIGVALKAYVSAIGPANVKTWNGLAQASVKTTFGLAIDSVKTANGLA